MLRRFLIKPEAMRRTLRQGLLFFLGGFGLIGIAFMGAPVGIFAGMMAMMYGAFCGSFQQWDGQKGLWMLASVFLLLIGPLYLLVAWIEMFTKTPSTWWAIELFLGTSLLALAVKLLLSVMVHNRRLSQSMNALDMGRN